MRARLVVVRDVLGQDAAQVRLVDDEQVVEALRARRADPALGVGVRGRRAVGRAHDLDPLGREDRVEGRRELGVAIVDEEAGRRARLLQRPGEVARLLRDPGGGRVGGAAGEVDAARADLEEEQDVQRLEEERLDGEEVAGQHGSRCRARKCRQVLARRPRCGAGGTRCRWRTARTVERPTAWPSLASSPWSRP